MLFFGVDYNKIQANFLSFFSSSSSGMAPTNCSTFSPFLKIMKWGIDLISNFWARWWFSSMFTFPNFIFPLNLSDISSTIGSIITHGMHQSAEKSTRTILSFMKLSNSFFDSSGTLSLFAIFSSKYTG